MIDSRIGIVQTSGVRHNGFNRNVVREHFVVRVEDRSALGEDRFA